MTLTSAPLRIWFNRTFATTYWLIPMLRSNPDSVPVTIYATHRDATSPVLQAADYSEVEPKLEGEAYIEWALSFCARHSINVFLPRHQIDLIAHADDRFAAIGVKVLVSEPSALELFADKNLTYQAAVTAGVATPPWRVASNADDFEQALSSLRSELDSDEAVVVKPTVGVGAQGFRVIDESPKSINDVLNGDVSVTAEQLIEGYPRAEAQGEVLPELMLLPFLDEPELSVDCLSNASGELLKMIPRAKLPGRQRLFTDAYPQATELVTELYRGRGLRYITNTQLRWWRGEAVLLETNTRPAGGLYATELTGVNLIWDAVRLAVFGEATSSLAQLGTSYIAVESFTKLNSVNAANS